MPPSERCPVCYAPAKEEIAYIDWMGPVCEHYVVCPNKCYDYEYAYGSTRIYVTIRGHVLMFGWHYSSEDIRAESDAADIAIKAAQKAQLEDYWVLVKRHGIDQARRPEEPGQPDMDNGLAL